MLPKLLGDIAEIVMGQSPRGETCFGSLPGVPLLNGPTEFGPYHPVPAQYTTDPRKFARRGDILFCVRGSTTGRMNWADQDYSIGRGIAAIRHKKGPRFQPYLRSLIEYRLPELLAQATGSTFPNIAYSQLSSLHCKISTEAEQLAIGAMLGALDDKIEQNRCMNDTLEAMGRAIFKSWFVDFEPVRAKAHGLKPSCMSETLAGVFPSKLVESDLGLIPEGWHCKPLHEVIAVNPVRALDQERAAPYVDMGNMPTHSARVLGWVDREFTSGMRFENGDTLVARITPCLENGKTAFVDFLRDKEVAWGSTEFIVLRPKPPLPPEYGYFLGRSAGFRAFAISNMSGTSGRQRVPADCFNRFYLAIPPEPISAEFGHATAIFFSKMKQNDEESITLAGLRNALLPKFMSREIRLKGDEKIVEANT